MCALDQSFPIIIQLLTVFFFFVVVLSLHSLSDGEDNRTGSILSKSCGKYERGKWRRNNCFPENHQDALEQSIYPSIYPQTAPLVLLGGQLWKPGSTGGFNGGKHASACLSVYNQGQQEHCCRRLRMLVRKVSRNALALPVRLRFFFHFPGKYLKCDP